jgi:hypothetical protein
VALRVVERDLTRRKAMNTVQAYLALPYTVVMQCDEDGDFVTRIEELHGCAAHGRTPLEAVEALQEAQ